MSKEVAISSGNQSKGSDSGHGRVALADAFEVIKLRVKFKDLKQKSLLAKEQHWHDFLSFMHAMYPNVNVLCNVTKRHADDYMTHLIHNGRYSNKVNIQQEGKVSYYENKASTLSPRTINGYLATIQEIFNLLCEDNQLSYNPFVHINKLEVTEEKREAFTPEELHLIFEKAAGNEFITGLFTLGLYTGLKEADICLLRWNEVDLDGGIIKLRNQNNYHEIVIPIMPPLANYLNKLKDNRSESEYVLPEHAALYQHNNSVVSQRVKKFLKELNIETTITPEGRSRAISVKDIYSLRYSFCSYAGSHNIPIAVVKSIIGHMSPEMNKHYNMNCETQEIVEKLDLIEKHTLKIDHCQDTEIIPTINRDVIKKIIDKLPEEKLEKVVEFLKNLDNI